MPPTPLRFIRNNPHIFARVGSVVASYRTRAPNDFWVWAAPLRALFP